MTEVLQKQAATLYKLPRFRTAFHNVILYSLRSNGYYDYRYISRSITRADVLVADTPASQLQYLTEISDQTLLHYTLKHAAVMEKRHLLLLELLRQAGYEKDIAVKDAILYEKDAVQLVEITSLPQYMEIILQYRRAHVSFYFRGHQNMNYKMTPSLFRSPDMAVREDAIYKQTLIEYPMDFYNSRRHFEKLVKMQHYQVCTRLLDLTTNPLVALFFACEDATRDTGQVLVFESREAPLFPDSDKVCMLSSLGFLKEDVRKALREEDAEAFSGSVSAAMLLHEIQRELPAFQPYIKQRDLRQVLLVQAAMDNIRIQRQNGLFFLCGNYASDDEELQSVLRNKLLHHEGKQMVFYIKKKEQLLEELKLVRMSHKDLYGNLQEAAWDIMHSAR